MSENHRGRTGAPTIRGEVYQLMHRRIGQQIYVADIARELDLTRKQVLNCLQGLRYSGHDIETVVAGATYVLRSELRRPAGQPPAATPDQQAKRLFEEIGATRDGTIIVQDSEGGLYRATEL